MRTLFPAALLGIIATLVSLCGASPALADSPMAQYPMEGTSDQPIKLVAAANDGGMWLVQHWSATNNTATARVARTDAAGTLLQSDVLSNVDARLSTIAPLAGGRAWLASATNYGARALWLLVPGEAPRRVALPEGQRLSSAPVVKGFDGNAWTTLCTTSGTLSCSATRLAADGTIDQFALPTQATTDGLVSRATANGLWYTWKNAGQAQVTFLTYAGQVTGSAPLPAGAVLIGPTADGGAWWMKPDAFDVGQIAPDGTITSSKHLPGSTWTIPNPPYPGAAIGYRSGIADGAGGLVWFTEDAAEERDVVHMGRLGPGVDSQYDFSGAAFAVPGTSYFGAGTCGWSKVTRTPDGALWFYGTGIGVDRFARWGTDGDWRLFTIPDAFGSLPGAQMLPLEPSSTGLLWTAYAFNGRVGLASVNPADPPSSIALIAPMNLRDYLPGATRPGPWTTPQPPVVGPAEDTGAQPARRKADPRLRRGKTSIEGRTTVVTIGLAPGANGTLTATASRGGRRVPLSVLGRRLKFRGLHGWWQVTVRFAGAAGWKSATLSFSAKA